MLVLCLALTQGCSTTAPPERAPAADPLAAERTDKDRMFRTGSSSPLPEAEKARFHGLAYFPPDPRLRFHVKLNRFPRPEQIRIGTNTGEIRDAVRYGYFEFEIGGRTCRLQAYRMEDNAGRAPSLFIPFRDATSGTETYAAGRYIDLKENTSGMYDLDFNRAYNPYCAYNTTFSCPVPPEENTLPVAVRAGEKQFPPAEGH
jgi:uncharacterized protein